MSDDRTTGDDTDATAAARATATKERIARDENLVKAAKSGEPKAYGRLFDAWFDHVWDRATQKGIPSSDVGDLATTVFANTWQSIDTGENASFATMVMRETRTSMPSGFKAPSVGNPAGARPEDRLTRATDLRTIAADGDVAGMLWEAGGVLGDRGRDVLDLHFRHGLTPEEIAEVLGLKSADVTTLVGKVPSAFANAVRARLLWRGGTPEDDELKADLDKAGKKTFDADAVRIIHARAKQSPRTRGRAMTPLAPIDVFAAIPVSAAPSGLKEKVAGSLDRQSIPVVGSQYLKKNDDSAGGAAVAAAGVVAGSGAAAAAMSATEKAAEKATASKKASTASNSKTTGTAGSDAAKSKGESAASKGGKAGRAGTAAAGGAAVGAAVGAAAASKAGTAVGAATTSKAGTKGAGGGGAELSAGQRQAKELEEAAAKKKQMTMLGIAASIAVFVIVVAILLRSGGSKEEVSTGGGFGTNTSTTKANNAPDQRPATSPPPTSPTTPTTGAISTTTNGNSTTTSAGNTSNTICSAGGRAVGDDAPPTTCVPVSTAPPTTAAGGGGAGGGGGGGGGGGNTTLAPTTTLPTTADVSFSLNPSAGRAFTVNELQDGSTTLALNWVVSGKNGTVNVQVIGPIEGNPLGFTRTEPVGDNIPLCPGSWSVLDEKCDVAVGQYVYVLKVFATSSPSIPIATREVRVNVTT